MSAAVDQNLCVPINLWQLMFAKAKNVWRRFMLGGEDSQTSVRRHAPDANDDADEGQQADDGAESDERQVDYHRYVPEIGRPEELDFLTSLKNSQY